MTLAIPHDCLTDVNSLFCWPPVGEVHSLNACCFASGDKQNAMQPDLRHPAIATNCCPIKRCNKWWRSRSVINLSACFACDAVKVQTRVGKLLDFFGVCVSCVLFSKFKKKHSASFTAFWFVMTMSFYAQFMSMNLPTRAARFRWTQNAISLVKLCQIASLNVIQDKTGRLKQPRFKKYAQHYLSHQHQ